MLRQECLVEYDPDFPVNLSTSLPADAPLQLSIRLAPEPLLPTRGCNVRPLWMWQAVDAQGTVRFECSSRQLLEESLSLLSGVPAQAAQIARNWENVGYAVKGWHKFVV